MQSPSRGLFLHDYTTPTRTFWWSAVLLGTLVLAVSLVDVARQPLPMTWLTALGAILVGLCGAFPIRQRKEGLVFSFGDFYTFLVLFAVGPSPATLVYTVDTCAAALRGSRRWDTRIGAIAIGALTMYVGGQLFAALAQWAAAHSLWNAGSATVGSLVFSATFALAGTALMLVIPLSRRNVRLTWAILIGNCGVGTVITVISAGFAAALAYNFHDRLATLMLGSVPPFVLIVAVLHLFARQQRAYLEAREQVAETLRRETEATRQYVQRLRASEQLFETAFRDAAIGMALVTWDGRLQQTNSALCRLLDRTEGALHGRDFAEFVLEPDRETWRQTLGRANGPDCNHLAPELRCSRRAAEVVWVAVACSAFTDPASGAPGLILQVQDVTARHEAETIERERARADAADVRRNEIEGRLRVLQAQIEPHFLYNTLANVQALVSKRPADAEAMLTALIHYLREALPKMRDSRSTLEREFALSQAYLEIARIRFGGRLSSSIHLDPAIAAREFPPLIVQTLVENALKHGAEPKVGPVHIGVIASLDDGRLVVTVADDGAGFNPGDDTGVGLRNIRERLKALYGDAARLEIEPSLPTGVRASVIVDTTDP